VQYSTINFDDVIIKIVYLQSGYITLKAKRIQPEDGIKKDRNM